MRSPPLARGLVGALLATAGLLPMACGGGATLAISASASHQLSHDTATVRADAVGDDPAAAAHDLAVLEATVSALERAGQLSAARAASILDAARTVQADLVLVPTTTTSTTTTTTTTTPGPKGPKHGGRDQGPGADG